MVTIEEIIEMIREPFLYHLNQIQPFVSGMIEGLEVSIVKDSKELDKYRILLTKIDKLIDLVNEIGNEEKQL